MIKTFRHKGLRRLYESGVTSGVRVDHVKRLRMQLAALDTACVIGDMDIPGFRLHPLKGEMRGRWSISGRRGHPSFVPPRNERAIAGRFAGV